MPVLKQNDVFAGRYLLQLLIGEGGFSEVWMAKDQMADDAEVAIKIYAPARGLDEWGLRQFRNEFSLTHNLSHPHLLKVNHFDVADGSPYLIMSYCPYGSLADGIKRTAAYTERQVALVMCQIGAALEEIHQQEPAIIHQDIKPDNILLMQPEFFVLADFGISSRIRNTLSKTTASMQALTVAYAPPERFDRHPAASAASDIFSLGVTLYEMCTHTVPWEGAGGQSLLKGARIPVLPATYSAGLSKILEACLSASRDKRPSAAEIHRLGRHYLETGQWSETKQSIKLPDLRKALVPSMAAAAVMFVAMAATAFFGPEQNIPSEKAGITKPVPIGAEQAKAMEIVPAAEPRAGDEIQRPTVAEKAAIEKAGPAVVAKSIKPQQDVSAGKPTKPLDSSREDYRKQAPVRQKKSPAGLQQSGNAMQAEKQPVKAPIARKENNTAPAVAVPPVAADRKTAVRNAPSQQKKAASTAAFSGNKSGSSKASRPATSNTTISKSKKSWLKTKLKSWPSKKKNAHKKRVRKLKRRFS